MNISKYLDFASTFKQIKDPLVKWAAQKENVPNDFFDEMTFQSARKSFLPVYAFSGKYNGTWNASSGYDREEKYTEWETRGDKEKLVTKTRTVTDWRPSNGQVSGSYSFKLCHTESMDFPNNSKHLQSVAKRAYNPSTSKMLHLNEMEANAEVHEDPGSVLVWLSEGDDRLRRQVMNAAKSRVPGDHHKDLSVDYSISGRSESGVYVPVWKVLLTYKKKEYEIYCGGNGNGDNIDGKLPQNLSLWALANAGYLLSGVSAALMLFIFSGSAYDWISLSSDGSNSVVLSLLGVSLVFLGLAGFWKKRVNRSHGDKMLDLLSGLTDADVSRLFENCVVKE